MGVNFTLHGSDGMQPNFWDSYANGGMRDVRRLLGSELDYSGDFDEGCRPVSFETWRAELKKIEHLNHEMWSRGLALLEQDQGATLTVSY